jgi:two-component system, chemotaxis family, protein-glutamate methylesterase/glutaminase
VRRSTERSADGAREIGLGYELAVIGASWGGLAALRVLVGGLPAVFRLPIAIVQHRHRNSEALLARFLQEQTQLRVCEIEDKALVEPGTVFVAPANYHVLVEQGHFSLSTEAPVRFSRPSIDVALTSAADAYGHRAVGIVLTGSNADGAEGLRRIADAGGMSIVQDPATAEAPTMPRAALQRVPTARVFPIDRIAEFLVTLPAAHGAAQAQ